MNFCAWWILLALAAYFLIAVAVDLAMCATGREDSWEEIDETDDY